MSEKPSEYSFDEIESNFNIKFSVSEIIDVKNVKDIKRHLNNHGVV